MWDLLSFLGHLIQHETLGLTELISARLTSRLARGLGCCRIRFVQLSRGEASTGLLLRVAQEFACSVQKLLCIFPVFRMLPT